MIDLEVVEKLLELLSESDADKIEVRDGDTSIKVSRNSGGAVAYQVAAPATPAPPAAPAAVTGEEGGAGEKRRETVWRSHPYCFISTMDILTMDMVI